MTENQKRSNSKVMILEAGTLSYLQSSINDFCVGKYVVGIQYPDAFQIGKFVAIVSYKVLEE